MRRSFRLLKSFALENPLAIEGYVNSIAVNVAHDHFKALHTQKRGAGTVDQLPEGNDPKVELGGFGAHESMEQQILLGEIGECLKACCAGPDQERDSFIFWLYYRQGLTAKSIAALLTIGLTAKGVESAIFRLTALLGNAWRHCEINLYHPTDTGKKAFARRNRLIRRTCFDAATR